MPHLQFSRLPYLFQDLFYFHGDCPNSLKDLPDPFNELVSPSLTQQKPPNPPQGHFCPNRTPLHTLTPLKSVYGVMNPVNALFSLPKLNKCPEQSQRTINTFGKATKALG